MCESPQYWQSTSFYDCTGRGRPKGFCVEVPSPRISSPKLISCEISTSVHSCESYPELVPPSVPLSSDDDEENVEKFPEEQNHTSKILAKNNKDMKNVSRKKEHHNLSIVCPPVELPLKRDDKQQLTLVLLPCLQFPESYCSPSEIIVDYWRRYHTMRVSFSQKEIGFFSTADRADRTRCREDYRYLEKLIYPLEQKKVHFDLNIGAEYLDVKEPPASLDSMMWWILRHKSELFINNKFTFDFLSWRGTLRKIMSSLFDSVLDWRIGIIRWNGCHFMTVFHTETELKIENEQTPIEKRMQYWGHKFEDYVTSNNPPLIPSPKKMFSTMNKATIGRHILLYSCEIDACTLNSTYNKEKKQGTYVEVKIAYAKHLLDLNTASSRKYAKWWQQCFLAGINHMLLGFRNDYGIVECLQPLGVKDIEIRAKTWSASAFISFLDEFCSFVRRTITKDWSYEDSNSLVTIVGLLIAISTISTLMAMFKQWIKIGVLITILYWLDRSTKRWDSDISIPTNISLLSVSSSSKSIHDDNEIDDDQHSRDSDSSSSKESVSSLLNESEEYKAKHVNLDPYIFNKHLNGIPCTISNLVDADIDESVNELFDESKSSYRQQNDEYNPRSIRPPSFSQYIRQVQESRTKPKPIQRRSARIPVRTTKAEQLKLARQQSANENMSNLPYIRPFTTKSQIRPSTISSINRTSRTRTNSNSSPRQSESARSCKLAIDSNDPLQLSAMLAKQMRQDIQIPAYSKPLSSALLREQPYPPLNQQYKMKRIHNWLKKTVLSEYLEYNEYASNESARGTNFNDKLDGEYDLLSDEKRGNNIERTYNEAHRVLPLFNSEIYRQMQQRNLLLTRIELDLYVI
ncbi:unnamed protein product [Rotaria sordida]|uniref:RAI1-like domain-containing protein n=1 Tax=Rotaria sordida TaxID=392033 RepID=A0A814EKT5_9BILA|nr:unnamed protein product [Rotaria sordida]